VLNATEGFIVNGRPTSRRRPVVRSCSLFCSKGICGLPYFVALFVRLPCLTITYFSHYNQLTTLPSRSALSRHPRVRTKRRIAARARDDHRDGWRNEPKGRHTSRERNKEHEPPEEITSSPTPSSQSGAKWQPRRPSPSQACGTTSSTSGRGSGARRTTTRTGSLTRASVTARTSASAVASP